jgi:drug/metabolite transporter (DMT)-like permease
MASSVLGISLATLSMLFFSILYSFYKACSPYLPNTVIIFFQGFCSWLIILPFALKGGVKELYSPKLFLIVLRTICGLLGIYFIAEAMKMISLSEVILFNNAAPLFVPLILLLWQKVKIPHKLWIGILTGFAGIIIILRPGFGDINAGVIFALLSGLCSSLLLVITRQIAHEPFIRILFYYFLVFWVALTPFLFTEWKQPPTFVWLFLACSAVASILAQLLFTSAMRHAPSHEVAPFIYMGVLFSGIIDWIVWHDKPDWISLVGMLVVCLGGVLTLVFSRRKIEV